jgi:hypothetical protein
MVLTMHESVITESYYGMAVPRPGAAGKSSESSDGEFVNPGGLLYL